MDKRYAVVMNILKSVGNDVAMASRRIYADYQRGNYTQHEYLEMMDVLSSIMMNGAVR